MIGSDSRSVAACVDFLVAKVTRNLYHVRVRYCAPSIAVQFGWQFKVQLTPLIRIQNGNVCAKYSIRSTLYGLVIGTNSKLRTPLQSMPPLSGQFPHGSLMSKRGKPLIRFKGFL